MNISTTVPAFWNKERTFDQHKGIVTDERATWVNIVAANAYQQGRQDGLREGEMKLNRAVREKLAENAQKVALQTSQVFDHLLERGFHPKGAHLKINSPNDFSVLVIVPENEFISKHFLDVYAYVHESETKIRKEYKISFSFVNNSRNFNKGQLFCEGYYLSFHRKSVKQKKARQAQRGSV